MQQDNKLFEIASCSLVEIFVRNAYFLKFKVFQQDRT